MTIHEGHFDIPWSLSTQPKSPLISPNVHQEQHFLTGLWVPNRCSSRCCWHHQSRWGAYRDAFKPHVGCGEGWCSGPGRTARGESKKRSFFWTTDHPKTSFKRWFFHLPVGDCPLWTEQTCFLGGWMGMQNDAVVEMRQWGVNRPHLWNSGENGGPNWVWSMLGPSEMSWKLQLLF